MLFTIREVRGKKKLCRKDVREILQKDFFKDILEISKKLEMKDKKSKNRNGKYQIFVLELYF